MNVCPNCKKEFHCGSHDKEPCWCCSLPNIVPLEGDSCLCKECLQIKIELIQQATSQRPQQN
jgi:hypothetical protein